MLFTVVSALIDRILVAFGVVALSVVAHLITNPITKFVWYQ